MNEQPGAAVFDPSAYTIIVRRVIMDDAPVFHGRVAELPDLEAFEPTHDEAYSFLVDAIQTAKAAFDEEGRQFPAPLPTETEYSGRVTIRMPKWLHARLDLAAQTDGTSLNQYMVAVLGAHLNRSVGVRSSAASGQMTTIAGTLARWKAMYAAAAAEVAGSGLTKTSFQVLDIYPSGTVIQTAGRPDYGEWHSDVIAKMGRPTAKPAAGKKTSR